MSPYSCDLVCVYVLVRVLFLVAQKHQENTVLKQCLYKYRLSSNKGLRRSSSLLSLRFQSFIANLKLPWDCIIIMLQHSLQLPVKPSCNLYVHLVILTVDFMLYWCFYCGFFMLYWCFYGSLYSKNLTHAQTTSTRPSCSPNRYKSENSAWDRG